VLDVGGGRKPSIPIQMRPTRVVYVGLDANAVELSLAGDAYTRSIVSDVCRYDPQLDGLFDVIVSTHTLEHVRPLHAALDNLHTYLKPDGVLVALFSGTFAPHAIANRIVPHRVARTLAGRTTSRPTDTVFPAHYDGCYAGSLRRMFDDWSRLDLTPLYVGAHYLRSVPWIQRLYLRYETRACAHQHENLASHYVIVAYR